MSAVALNSLATSMQLVQASGHRLSQRLAALNTTAAAQLKCVLAGGWLCVQLSGLGNERGIYTPLVCCLMAAPPALPSSAVSYPACPCSWCRDAEVNWHSLIDQLASAVAAPATSPGSGTRQLQQEQPRHWGPEMAAERLQALAERLRQLRADRAALRARIREALGHGASPSRRKLRQAVGVDPAHTDASDSIAEAEGWLDGEEADLDAPLWQDSWDAAGVASPSYVIVQVQTPTVWLPA